MCLNQRHAGDLWYKITLKILYMQFFIKNVLKIDFKTQMYQNTSFLKNRFKRILYVDRKFHRM